jgi:hypothetical protein
MTADSIARLKITLDNVKPAVTRRIEVPLAIRLDRLHLAIQAAMGWTNTHLYEFRIRDIGWGIPDPERDYRSGPLDARKATLLTVLEDTGAKTFKYLYDFGDGWQHTIKIERISPADPNATYPILIEAIGRCPPEDVGGPPGYEEFLEAIADPEHERHAEMHDWCGEDFDPLAVDASQISQALRKLATKWTRTARPKAKPTAP